ncbi:MAG: acyl-CoA dehydrogenase family protein [Myxococcota bacterium]|jgi:alkylation response protein AidB-like acyl-CoA dehydrogenase|nr:acyl-CoA dehydrogenase family protein [Myxococcota bacterium]
MSSENLEEFQQDVRSWIDENLPADLRVGNRKDLPGGSLGKWIKAVTSKGWVTPQWPTEYGGGNLDRKQAAILMKELKAVRAPIISSFGTSMLGPTLLEFGTDEQKEEFLPAISRHEVKWCQGYSEPGAGSDLASLQTRAVKEGDEYVITGQKIWTTGADKADWIFCLVRTDPEAPKHEGITFILFPMHQEGVEVSPLTLIDGSAEFSQVFFNGARAKASHVVGPVNGGWTVAKRLLQHERTTDGGSEGGITGALKETLTDIVKREIGLKDGVLADPTLRQRLAAQELEARGLSLTMRRAGEELRSGQAGRDIGSLGKYRWANMVKNEQDLAMAAMGTQGLGWSGPGFEDTQLERTRAWLTTRADSIWGGTNEVQMNVIAKRVLKIPE